MKSLLRLSLAFLSLGSAAFADFALRDGDTVAFLGDSITAARHYGKTIETYTLMRFPERKIRFMNVGRGGETAKGGLARIDEILNQGVTVLTVAYGINDIGWGTKADDLHRNEYLDSISAIIDRRQARNVRVFIASAAITAEEPEKAEDNFLQRMCDDAQKRAREKGAGTIDVQRTMREVQRRAIAHNKGQKDKSKPTKLHAEDGVHLNDLGQLAMAYAFLKGFDAPADVSSLEIDAANLSASKTENCRVSEVVAKDGQISFTRTDLGLPLNLHHFWSLQFIYIPMGEEINRYMLTVRNLPEGKYDVTAGGRGLGQWTAGQLAKGLNISSSTADGWQPGGPWDVQSRAVKVFTDMRDELIAAGKDAAEGLTEHPDLAEIQRRIAETEKLIVDLQRSVAKPVPVNFVIKPVAEKSASIAPGR